MNTYKNAETHRTTVYTTKKNGERDDIITVVGMWRPSPVDHVTYRIDSITKTNVVEEKTTQNKNGVLNSNLSSAGKRRRLPSWPSNDD